MGSSIKEPPGTARRLVEDAVHELARRTRFPVAFGGLHEDGLLRMSAFHGTRTDLLDGLAVRPRRGLGGIAFVEKRPRMASDYRSARQITHDYDRQVLGEGIGTLLAVPVIVDGRPRGVLYGGAWGQWGVGGVTASSAMDVAELLARQLRDLDALERTPVIEPRDRLGDLAPSHREELRESYAELRRIAALVDDPAIRSRLEEVEQRLAALSGMKPQNSAPISTSTIHLTPRETDVLACAALGATNAGIASELGLREGTVKAYLGAAMAKLDASTRLQAVAKARRAGILP
ncbi:MAG: LuxR C-terminal-related transcriptional regulator [Microbacterium sp.]